MRKITNFMKSRNMRKGLAGIIIAMAAMVSICGCGQEDVNNYASVQIGKKSYDLTEDVEEFIRKFNGDGHYIGIFSTTVGCTENAIKDIMLFPDGHTENLYESYEMLPEPDSYYRMDIVCSSFLEPPEEELERVLASAKTYSMHGFENSDWHINWNGKYVLGAGIAKEYSVSGIDEIYGKKDAEEWFPEKNINTLKEINAKCKLVDYHTVADFTRRFFVLAAVYYDGVPVDLYSYFPEDIYGEWEACNYMQYGLRQLQPLHTTFPYIMDGPTYSLADYTDINWESIGLECAFDTAYREGAERIVNGEISEVVAVSLTEKSVKVTVMKKEDSILIYDPKLDSLYFSKD